jgi:CHAT domain-containing protein
LSGAGAAARTQGEGGSDSFRFVGQIKAAYRLATAERQLASQMISATFLSAQLTETSQTAASLGQMAARQAKGDTKLARLIRELQDLTGDWQTRDKQLVAALSQPPGKRNGGAEEALRTRLAAIEKRSGEIKASLTQEFPEYAALSSPEPLSVAETQAILAENEALILILDTPEWKPTPEETFAWVLTKTAVRWAHFSSGNRALAARVTALRCGLDQAAWDGEGAARCTGLLRQAYTPADAAAGKPLPFDLGKAHELYTALFGSVDDLIKNKHLLIVAAGPLSALPFHVLITDKPSGATSGNPSGYADAAWLGKRNAITVLPSVASLKALRQFAKTSKATQPFIGFGNPLLLGPDGNDRRAWDRQSCKAASTATVQVASRGVRSAIPKFFRSGLADVEEVRAQYPLPETADELCAVAKSTGAADGAIYLGEQASEKTIKALSANGTLATARILHFATHGLLAGETEMLAASKAEPALILTPPAHASEEDDGLLTVSEITQLKLDANWVVLSACNTAAGASIKPGAEALSGLARAFFYAGARALLVSHWAVNSDATVKLVTKAFDELKANPAIGRAEALRRSMRALIASGDRNAHPANWAPFVVVGEGAR